MNRPALLDVLADGLRARRPGALRLGARIADASQSADGVPVTIADGSRVTANLLIGADGVHSVTRAQAIATDAPRFSGCIAWRGVIPIESDRRSPAGACWPHRRGLRLKSSNA